MLPENTRGVFVLARSCILTNNIVSQEDTTGWGENFQRFDQLQCMEKHKIRKEERKTKLSDPVLKVKTRTKWEYKVPLPCRRYQMICAISHCKDAELRKCIEVTQPLPPPEVPDLCNNFISKESDYIDRFCINFPRHCAFGHVFLDYNPLNDVDSWKEVVWPTKKPRSVGPHKLEPKKTTSKKDKPEEQEIQECDNPDT